MTLRPLSKVALLFGVAMLLGGLGAAKFPSWNPFSHGQAAAAPIKPVPKHAVEDRGPIYEDCMVLGKRTQSPYKECVFGRRGSDTTVVLYGDSHALQYSPTMIRLAEEKGWRLVALVRQGCPVAQVKFEEICDKWRHNTMRRIIQREKPGLVVLSTATTKRYKVMWGNRRLSRKQSQPHLREGMVKILQRLRNSGARVVVIRDQVVSPVKPPICVRRNYKRPNQNCSFRPTGRRDRQGFDAEAASRVKQVQMIDPVPKLCANDLCRVVWNRMLVYRDKYHLTATFADALAPWLGRQLPTPNER